MVFGGIDHRLTQVKGTDPVPMLEFTFLVEVRKAVYDEVSTDKVDLVA